MAYNAKIIADSIAPSGRRLTTFEVTFPRIVLAEFNTHRQFSRNSASSRAIPVAKMLQRVMDDPFIPVRWPVNQKGMQAQEYLAPHGIETEYAQKVWLQSRDEAVFRAKQLVGQESVNSVSGGLYLSVHKQIANRLLEPFLWHTVIVTATEYSNFFAQRCHKDAQPEIQTIAYKMKELYEAFDPVPVKEDDWHLPYLQADEREACTVDLLIKLSVARCARVSYLSHDGIRDHSADCDLYDKLTQGMHFSPFEHVAQSTRFNRQSGNFWGWKQFRKGLENECR